MKIKSAFIISLFSVTCVTCDDQDTICALANLADLVISELKVNESGEDSSGETVYAIAGLVVNTVEGLGKCGEKGGVAAENKYQTDVYYSPYANFAGAKKVSPDFALNVHELKPSETTSLIEEVKLLVDGYYQVTSSVDVNNDVLERHEDNNTFGASENLRTNTESVVIHVKGRHKVPKIVDGRQIYLTHMSRR